MAFQYYNSFMENRYRLEVDSLGEQKVLQNVLYGGQTARALENFPLKHFPISNFPYFIIALAMVKQACARTNKKLKLLSPQKADLIEKICLEIIDGKWHENFCLNIIQGGAGTSTNMNMNEVIANRASQIMKQPLGSYQVLHPNNDVNLSQSTNDVYPTAVRLSILLIFSKLCNNLEKLSKTLYQKSQEFQDVIKLGRTQLQDAVPVTLGQTFHSYFTTLKEESEKLKREVELFREINLGATAIGTGINTHPEYNQLVVDELCNVTKVRFYRASDLIEATSDMGAFVSFSSTLKRLAIKLSRICNDLRLMNSGPRGGLNEINLPPRQPGSSIMPGKINPVIPELINQISFQVIGRDLSITLAAEAGQLELNVMAPVIAYNLHASTNLLTSATEILEKHCVRGITANKERCRELVENSTGLITTLNNHLGYQVTSKVAKEALRTNKKIIDVVVEKKYMSREKAEKILDPFKMLEPNLKTTILK